MGEIGYIPLKCLKTPSICVAALFIAQTVERLGYGFPMVAICL